MSNKERESGERKSKGGHRRGNRPQPGRNRPPTAEVGTDQSPDLNTDCHPTEEEEEPRAGVRGQGSDTPLFLLLSVARDDNKKHHDCLDQKTDFTLRRRRTDGDEGPAVSRWWTNKPSFRGHTWIFFSFRFFLILTLGTSDRRKKRCF